ncbi:hypothetical protein ACO22_05749 [Paracoccidioides brasiliensis]|uniref:Uncharacterized protein n=1 Tax=Paracoccidioides brasiliensis TaxID=121759 RepID=A0A1D2J9D9_PARBR|nr:hypothetical protein ACO22_05749 [Paracoccidioides brasiliensis]
MSTHLQFYLPGPCNNATPTHLQSKLEGETQELEKQLISPCVDSAGVDFMDLAICTCAGIFSSFGYKLRQHYGESVLLVSECRGLTLWGPVSCIICICNSRNWSISVLRGMRQDAFKLRTRARNINHALPDPFESVVHLSWICNRTIYWILELPLAAQVP